MLVGAEHKSHFCRDTGYWLLDAGWKIPHRGRFVKRCKMLVGAERKSRSCGNTDYRLLDEGMIEFSYPASSNQHLFQLNIILIKL